jgi:hypothetical protein
MAIQFNCSRKGNGRSLVLLGIMVCVLVSSVSAWSQTDKTRLDVFKKEASSLQEATEQAVEAATPGMAVLQHAKATYLEGYGIVVTVQAALVPNRNPFAATVSSADVRKVVAERRTQLRQRVQELVKQQAASLQSLGSEESLAIVVYLLNSNAADVPDLPAQIVFAAKKNNPNQINVYEF